MKKIIRFLFIIFYILATYNFVNRQVNVNSPIVRISMNNKGKERKFGSTKFNSEDELRKELIKNENSSILERYNTDQLKIKKLFNSKKLDKKKKIESFQFSNEEIENLNQESFTTEDTPKTSNTPKTTRTNTPNTFTERLKRMSLSSENNFKIRNRKNSGIIRTKEERIQKLKPFMRMAQNYDEKNP